MLKETRQVVMSMISDFDQSVVGVLYGGKMLEDRIPDAMQGSLKLVQIYCKHYDNDTCMCAAGAGRLDVLVWLRSQDPPCSWDNLTCMYAAGAGRLDVLEWLRSQDPPCPWDNTSFGMDSNACTHAAYSGHLDVLVWLRSQDPPCPWDEWVCRYAAINGHLDVLEWAKANRCPE
tara:strand:- start:25269 stop:25790 length:522 start_codon:yes stop_codon:yes gene_type:complete